MRIVVSVSVLSVFCVYLRYIYMEFLKKMIHKMRIITLTI